VPSLTCAGFTPHLINTIQLSCKTDLEEMSVTKLKDKIGEVKGHFILQNL